MTQYKHTQWGYLMLAVTGVVAVFFVYALISAAAELPSVDSGTNLLVTTVMMGVLVVLFSCSALTVSLDERYLRVVFGYGIFSKRFLVKDIASVRVVKNSWYYGWGIRFSFRPRMWIYNVSGFDAVEITTRDNKVFRIGTDVPQELVRAIEQAIIK